MAQSTTDLALPRLPRNTTLLWIAYAGLALFCAGVAALARSQWYEELYSDYWYVLYRIRWETFQPGK